jgi:hypothetical protein
MAVAVMDNIDVKGGTEEEEEDRMGRSLPRHHPHPRPPPLQDINGAERNAIKNYVDRQHQRVVDVVVSVVPFRSSCLLDR